ncbi:MAG: hypothetical protein MRY21_06395 [Simkaniaceae bacterium]|nr:hypothetical protein [Simkaniaceae bacterium]
MKKIFYLLLLPLAIFANTLSTRLGSATPGDYIVTEYEEVYSMLCVHSKEGSRITLEEINIPWHALRGKKKEWKKWLENEAPGHSSWILYEIDLETHEMLECFSRSQNCFLNLSDSFLTTLLTLPLAKIDESSLTKVGPPPLAGKDTRNAWSPPRYLNGSKIISPNFSVYRTTLPDNETPLSGKTIDLYFDDQSPFPYWLKICDPTKGSVKLRSIDSGSGALSNTSHMPRRIPTLVGKRAGMYILSCPKYYVNPKLCDLQEKPIAFTEIREGETVFISFEKARGPAVLSYGDIHLELK